MLSKMNLNRCIVLVMLAVCLLSTQAVNAQQIPTLSVCDVFEDLQSWNGKLMAVHGEYYSTLHDAMLTQRDCPVSPETDGERWPTTIDFLEKYPPSLLSPKPSVDPSVKFFSGLIILLADSYLPGWRTDRYKIPNQKLYRLTATFVGVLRVSTTQKYRRLPDGTFGGGYGRLGQHPAALDVRAIRDITITNLDTASGTGTERQQ
ncbi:MAG: hypothetical protein HY651_10500 [Acidobacteria bacterium]|nr:hypothetical protein [Acidobacteriota bacterium]